MNDLAGTLARVLSAAKLGPRPLADLKAKAEIIYEEAIGLDLSTVIDAVRSEGEGGAVTTVLRNQLMAWDFEPGPAWGLGTAPNTRQRRDTIYTAMEVPDVDREVLDARLPFFEAEPITVIASKRWERWYTPERRQGTYYWDTFAGYLRQVQRWPEESVLSLDEATTAVVERLAEPTGAASYQSKGLVVGYVQSGKTANITGVVAKAADAGYRLVVVLAGTQNMLRNQTQRRLDQELLGAELVEDEYLDDAEWDRFLRHGAKPSARGSFDWARLTGRSFDYHKLAVGSVDALRFPKLNARRPFNDAENLYRASAKLVVAKKNAAVLDKLAKDLARVNPQNELAEVPTLIIDDESDQASVNTIRPPESAEDETERTRVNAAIVGLLRTLPRSQYVGYTATPFANVFIDPADAQDLFPKDFIVSLRRSPGYLGAGDFHDLQGLPSGTEHDPFRSNERAYVRAVYGDDHSNNYLQQAIDSFVLSGALKLYREERSTFEYRHHTMMVHTSHLTAGHRQQVEAVNELLADGGYQTGECIPRLRVLLDEDFLPVSRSRAAELARPESLDDLEDKLGEVVRRLYESGNPVLLVNSNADADQLSFDADPVWKIIVGGSKLSRGFTIEGLTVSYFRRRSPTADTLMQMGRWCGFRSGYADLVRLFIARAAPGDPDAQDVYQAFEAICRDEDSFREELRRYATPSDGTDPITPRDVAPLVASHLDWVRPTSRNKMYNARISFRNFGGRPSEHRLAPTSDDDISFNERLFRGLLEQAPLEDLTLDVEGSTTRAFVALAPADAVRSVLGQYRWYERRKLLEPELEFLSGHKGDPEIDDWAIILPQLQHSEAYWALAGHQLSVHLRSRLPNTNLVNAYSGPEDRKVAAAVAGSVNLDTASTSVKQLRHERRGALLVYPIAHSVKLSKGWAPTIGFTLVFPPNHIRQQIGFVVRDPDRPDEPIVAT